MKKILIYPPYLNYKKKFIPTVFDVKTMNVIIGTEISFPRSSNYTNYFSATESYIINISELEKNRTKFIFEWNPVKALKVLV